MTLNQEIAHATHLEEAALAGYVINATKEVFGTMVMMTLEDSYPLKEPVTSFHCSVTGMVGLAGTYTGILSIHCPKAFAMRITSNMLGMEVEEIDDDVNDAMGEIANMIGGNIKNRMPVPSGLSLPTVAVGARLTARFPGTQVATQALCSLPDGELGVRVFRKTSR